MTRDRMTGVISVILGIIVAAYAFFLPPSGAEGDVGPALFPYIAAVLLIFCGLVLAVKRSGQTPRFFTDSGQLWRFLIITLVYILYGVLLWAVGFLIATPIACFVLCRMMGGSDGGSSWNHALFSLVVTGVVYYSFYVALSLKLPVGRIIRFRL